jgi:hypothetical protein
MRALGFSCSLAIVLSAFMPARGQAQARGPALNWTRQPGAEACIGSVELGARIEERLKKRVFVAAPDAIVAVEGYVAPDPTTRGFRASIALSDGEGALYGSRELSVEGNCRALDEGLVFVIAVSLRPQGSSAGIALPELVARELDALFGAEPTEPEAAAFPVAPSTAPAERTAPAVEAKPPAPASAQRAATKGDDWALALEAVGIAQSGLQPVGTFGGGLGLRARLGSAGTLGVSGALGVATKTRVDGELRSRAAFTNRLLTLGYCTPAVLEGGALEAMPCAHVRVGEASALGETFLDDNNQEHTRWLLALGLAARAQWAVSARLALGLSVGLELRALRPAFAYVSQAGANEELYTASLVGAAAELSVVFVLF